MNHAYYSCFVETIQVHPCTVDAGCFVCALKISEETAPTVCIASTDSVCVSWVPM